MSLFVDFLLHKDDFQKAIKETDKLSSVSFSWNENQVSRKHFQGQIILH